MDHNYNMIISYSTRYKYKSPRASMLMLPSPQLQVTNVTHQICNLSGLSLISVQARHVLLANRFPSLLDLQTPWVFKKKHSIYLSSSTNIWEIYQESRLTMISNDFQHTSSKHSNSPFEPQRSQPLPLPAFQPGHFGYQQKHGENMGKWSENISDSTTHFHDFPWKVAEIMFSCEFLKPLWAWMDQWMND